ncbi:MAG: class I adenylate cyclase [Desulfobacula sp.]|uniref:class I adenylate cyclase n=1 Tax=Desulfobacula sp. TaxID=2593537 RepID=UPI0025C65EA9|nr:class I adenylate cyclase [Desulfobacula sp.]MCD4719881.1 class I adenylate cyclase [Desulfobacula sp.]
MSSLVTNFDFNTFEAQWEKLSEEEKAIVVKESGDLEPNLSILPTLAGITSYHFSVRNNARKSFEIIESKIRNLIADPSDKEQYLKGMKESASVCSRIYAHINPDMTFKELSYYFKTLLEFDGKGAHFAFKAVYQGLVPMGAMEKIIFTISEPGRLAFVDQYLQTCASIRLKFGFSFNRILKSIKQRKTVVQFYADLFDMQRDADPFLNNINPDLRDPHQIISNEIQSQSPEIKITGLKALAMIVTKIPSELLLDILAIEEVKKVRITIYKIIEKSSMGVYPEVFYPILELFYKCDKQEAFHAFKALVVSGKLPLYTLLEMVRDNYPTLMPVINIEISALSKISFFIIQDIALNKEKYLNSNFEVNLACVLGMIKKRPERVVKILKKYDDDSRDSVRMDVTRFIEKTKQLLTQEKSSIETQFDPTIQLVKHELKKSKGLIKTLFINTSKKRIEELKSHKQSTSIDFKSETIKDADLSSCVFIASSLFFSNCIITNCNFSNASFSNAFFKGTIFYNVDMQKTQFDCVNFDNAFFINVNAKGSVFKNCSFQNVSIFNCSFNHANLRDAPFLNSFISKTSFNQTDLSGSCFAYSKISAISFVNSNIDQADFSGVNARFCRFPTSARSVIKTDDIDYNARKFQLSFKDMPHIDETIVTQIDMLIFSEFIHYGESKFLKQNRLSLLTAFDIFKTKQADLFQLIPFLLHENIIFPGIETINNQTPCGICDYIPSRETQETFIKYKANENIIARRCQNYTIEGLFTIGSIGSLAQTADSDIDYWVCINEDHLTLQGLKLFKKKLKILENMAWEQFNTKVTFFSVDILKAKNNDFGDSTIESSGSAQTRLLKEEFYRTMIYVAGKIPLWSVLPTAISINYYNSILKNVADHPNIGRYIDLGDIHAISTSEYFGASIWQMFKWLKSPFKSVIKMALLEKYIYEYGKESLLCNKYKDEWMNSGAHLKLAQNDSYYILLKNLLKYYETAKDEQSVTLLLTCFFLKLGISKDSDIDNTVFGLRKILLEKCMEKWGWSKENIFQIGSFKTWTYSDITTLSNTIEKFMVKKYKTVNKAFERLVHGQSRISPEDRTVLGRKVFIEFSKQADKVEKVLLISRSDRHFQGLHLKYIKANNKIGTWDLLNKNAKAFHDSEESLIKANTIEEIGAWLINNSLYNENIVINLVPNPTYVTFDDIRKLFKTLYDFFRPLIKSTISFDQLLLKNRVVCLFISINFYAPKQQRKVTEYTAIYLNSWGEMFCKSFYSDQGFLTMEETKKDIMNKIGIKKLPLNTAFYFSKGVAR